MTVLRSHALLTGDDVSPEPFNKLSVPKDGAFLVPRRWLFDELTQGVGRPVTVVMGPPGWGKTTLVASWVAHDLAPGRVAWLTLDAEDDDQTTFWTSVVQALVLHGVDVPGQLQVPGEPLPRSFLKALTTALARSEETVVLVLDGFEAITDPAIERDVAVLLRSAAPDLRLVLTTRREPEVLLRGYRPDELTVVRLQVTPQR
jgi:LuxR family maltose regulon positive regulatory protein